MIATAFKRSVLRTSRPVRRERGSRPWAAYLLALWALGAPGVAKAEDRAARATEHYLQYGVGFSAETVPWPGSICPDNAAAPCILKSGVGLVVRIGYRARGPFYLGGAYEFSRQESSNLLRLAILQQLRGEARYYLREDTRFTPYLAAAAGGALYGNEWGFDTGGIVAFLGAGFEFQVSGSTVVGAALGYRPLVFRRWKDSAGQVRADDLFGFGVAHLIAGELTFEVRNPLSRW
jgi:hypothetical protein